MSIIKTLMLKARRLIPLLILTVAALACKKDNNALADCLSNAPILRHITSKQATIKSVDKQFYIVEKGAIDTKLNPCNLPVEFREDDLKVIISGEIKLSLHAGAGPCCTENLIITKITRL